MDRPESHLEESLDAYIRSVGGVRKVTVLKTYRVITTVDQESTRWKVYDAEESVMDENPKLDLSFATKVEGDDDD